VIRIFRVLIPASVLTLFLAETVLIFGCYAASAFLAGDMDGEVFLLYDSGLARIAIVVGLILAGLYFHNLYAEFRVPSRILLLQHLCMVIGIAFIAEAVIGYWNGDWAVPRNILIPGSALVLVTILPLRLGFNLAIQNAGVRRVLFLGLSPTVIQLAGHLQRHPELGLAPVGYLDRNAFAGSTGPGITWLGPVENLVSIVDRHRPDWIVVGRREEIGPAAVEGFLELRFGGVYAEQASTVYETVLGRVCASEIFPSQLIYSDALQPDPVNTNLQSIYSPAVAVLLGLIALPLAALIAVLVKASSPGPVLLRQRRAGLHGAPFTTYQFRWIEERDGELRSTPVGRFLRRFGLHALPQLWNVIRGQMSMVGPQPERPEFAERLGRRMPFYAQRTGVKPGMTGWAQVQDFGGDTTPDTIRGLEYDLYYAKTLSPSLDLFVLLRSIKRVLVWGSEL